MVGGDGIIHEFLNGIMERDDHEQVLEKLKFGVVGCGTANGFATSVSNESNELYGPANETFIIAKGRTVRGDLSKYTTKSNSYISFLTFTWAIIADVDIESERIHWLGESRFDVWAFLRVLTYRRYRGRLSYLPPPPDPINASPPSMPALDKAVPNDWKVIEDDFVLFWTSHIPDAAVSLVLWKRVIYGMQMRAIQKTTHPLCCSVS